MGGNSQKNSGMRKFISVFLICSLLYGYFHSYGVNTSDESYNGNVTATASDAQASGEMTQKAVLIKRFEISRDTDEVIRLIDEKEISGEEGQTKTVSAYDTYLNEQNMTLVYTEVKQEQNASSSDAEALSPEIVAVFGETTEVDFYFYGPSTDWEYIPDSGNTGAIVFTAAGLKETLQNASISYIRLGNHIQIETEPEEFLIEPNRLSDALVLDGAVDPSRPEDGRYTLTEYQTDHPQAEKMIRLMDQGTVRSITIKNMQIQGGSTYGTIYIGCGNVRLEYDNIAYEGPQVVHNNKVGSSLLLKDSVISIRKAGSGTSVGKAADVQRLELAGKVTITKTGEDGHPDELFWIGASGYDPAAGIYIKDGADVRITDTNRAGLSGGFALFETGPAKDSNRFSVGNAARFEYQGAGSFIKWGNLNSFEVGQNAAVYIGIEETLDGDAVIDSGLLTVGSGSVLHGFFSGELGGGKAIAAADRMVFDNPKHVLFFQTGGGEASPVKLKSEAADNLSVSGIRRIRQWTDPRELSYQKETHSFRSNGAAYEFVSTDGQSSQYHISGQFRPDGSAAALTALGSNLTSEEFSFSGRPAFEITGGELYTLRYDGNGATRGTVTPEQTGIIYGTVLPVAANSGNLSVDKLYFAGWSETAGGPLQYSPTSQDSAKNSILITDNTTLYAVWQNKGLERYAITFMANGAEGGSTPNDSRRYDPGDTAVIPGNPGGLYKRGKYFGGWSGNIDGSGAVYQEGEKVEMEESLRLYAQWLDAESVVLRYEANLPAGAKIKPGTTVPPRSSHPVNSYVKLAENKLVVFGYDFIGWSLTPEGEDIGEIDQITEHMAVYALWKGTDEMDGLGDPLEYVVTYHSGDAQGFQEDPDSPYLQHQDVTILDQGSLSKEGAVFIGWAVTPSGPVVYAPGDVLRSIRADLNLYPVWRQEQGGNIGKNKEDGFENIDLEDGSEQKPTYSILYHKGDAYIGIAPTDKKSPYLAGSTVRMLRNTNLVRMGYHFVGWAVTEGGDLVYEVGAEIESLEEDLDLYPAWEPDGGYTVTYDRNIPRDEALKSGNAPVKTETEKYSDILLEGNSGNMVRYGYEFGGWSLRRDGSALVDRIEAIKDPTIVYAVWHGQADSEKPITHKLIYHDITAVKGKIPSGVKQSYLRYEDAVLAENNGGLVRYGYDFAGWSVSPGGVAEYQPGDTVEMTGDLNLYPAWTEVGGHVVTYHPNIPEGEVLKSGAAPVPETISRHDRLKLKDNAGEMVRLGYDFDGWCRVSDGTMPVTELEDITEDISVYAVWKNGPSAYGINYHAGDAEQGEAPADPSAPYLKHSEAVLLDGSRLAKTGFEFVGWATKEGGSLAHEAGSTLFDLDKEWDLYPAWKKADDWTITYHANLPQDANLEESTRVPLPTFHQNGSDAELAGDGGMLVYGYDFIGWSLTPGTQPVSKLPEIGQNTEVYAVWKGTGEQNNPADPGGPIEYSLTYQTDGMTGGEQPASVTYKKHENVVLDQDGSSFWRTGYDFAGWRLDDQPITKITRIDQDYTVAADWAPAKDVQIIYNMNLKQGETLKSGIRSETTAVKKYAGLELKADAAELIRLGYDFAGWSLDPDGNRPVSNLEIVSEDTVIYAIWNGVPGTEVRDEAGTLIKPEDPIYHPVYYQAGDAVRGEVPENSGEAFLRHSDVSAQDTSLVKIGHNFDGWAVQEGGSSEYRKGRVIADLTEELSLYPSWRTAGQVQLNYEANLPRGASLAEESKVPEASRCEKYDRTVLSDGTGMLVYGYDFVGWSLTPDGELVTEIGSIEKDQRVYAIWNGTGNPEDPADIGGPVTYKVSYQAMDQDGGSVPEETWYKKYEPVSLPGNSGEVFKLGHDFNGWIENGEPLSAIDRITRDYVVEAGWSPAAPVTLAYDANVDSGARLAGSVPDPVEAVKHDSMQLEGNSGGLVRGGYEFAGWSPEPEADAVVEELENLSEDMTVYAVWNANEPEPSRNASVVSYSGKSTKPRMVRRHEAIVANANSRENEPAVVKVEKEKIISAAIQEGGGDEIRRETPPDKPYYGKFLVRTVGGYEEFKPDGRPLGKWTQAEEGTWNFHYYAPGTPKTGDQNAAYAATALIVTMVVSAGTIIILNKKKVKRSSC